MYIDGHKREDVVAYRNVFVGRWAGYKTCFHFWDDNGNSLPPHRFDALPSGFALPLILVTHDKSTFFQNDERKTSWSHQDSWPAPKPKGDGQSLMVSDFLTAEWGCLHNNNRSFFFFFFFLHILLTILQKGPHCVQTREESQWVLQSEGTHHAGQLGD